MQRTGKRAIVNACVCLGICFAFSFTAFGGTLAADIPEYYKIEGVPLYQQIDAKGCGAASLQLVFDYWGPFIDQKEIYNAARSGGTTLPDMARAAQFSDLSTTMGSRWPDNIVSGYTGRSVGYAGFFYASDEPWLDEMKYIISRGYPVIALVWWWPGWESDDHYRVIVGYDDREGVLLINDVWCREFKNEMDYQGSTTQWAIENAQDEDFGNLVMTYEDFLETWRCPTDVWGVPGKRYGGVFAAPWEISISAPEQVSVSEEFQVTASVKYPCLSPFGTSAFPAFEATDLEASLTVGTGLDVVVSPDLSGIEGLVAGETIELTWTLRATEPAGTSFDIFVGGLVGGSLGIWKDYPAYDYRDLIGGTGSWPLTISS